MDVDRYITDEAVTRWADAMSQAEDTAGMEHLATVTLRAALPGILAAYEADRAPHIRAEALREAADTIEASVPPDVFLPEGTSTDANSARLRRADADWLRRMADEAVADD